MSITLLTTQEALNKAAARWENGFYKDKQNQEDGRLKKPLGVDGKEININYEEITNHLKSGAINRAEKIALIQAGLTWGEYKETDLDEETRDLIGKE